MEQTYFRRYPRIKTNFPVQCTTEDGTHSVRALTLGGGGLFLGISRQIPPDAKLSLRFRPARHFPMIVAQARVRYHLPEQGIGIEFTEIKPEHRQAILRLIYHRMIDKRQYPRAPLAAQVEHESGTSLGLSREISAGGMFIETDKPVPVNSKLDLLFHLDDGGPIVRAQAEVLYVVAKLGMGVRFTEISPADRNRIEAYVAKVRA
jgi:c-di-GMP-binding flagellar brake protein YcgR